MLKIMLAAFLCAYLHEVSCLRCYECSEATNPNCVKPPKNVPSGQCKQPSDVCITHTTPAAVLQVGDYTVNMTTRVIRGCKFEDYCEYVKNFSAECTACAQDFCNLASYRLASVAIAAATIFNRIL